jgi:hypothetical protein
MILSHIFNKNMLSFSTRKSEFKTTRPLIDRALINLSSLEHNPFQVGGDMDGYFVGDGS